MNILIALGAALIGLLSLMLHITMNDLVKAKLQIQQTPEDDEISRDADTVKMDLDEMIKVKKEFEDDSQLH
jgi:hypothetical protein